MKRNVEMTGYPSIDKPWLKYYSSDAINTPVPACTIYQNIYDHNKDYPNDVALLYFGKKFTYKQLFTAVDKVAKALVSYGVCTKENVVLCMPAIPETIYTILALNKLGANAVMINPLFTENQLVERISETGAKIILVANELYSKVEKVIPQTAIKTVISCSAVQSLGRIVQVMKKVRPIPHTVVWKDFLKHGNNTEFLVPAYTPNQPAIMVYSSGTTGASKGIQLTNDGVNATINEGVQIGFEWQRGDRWFSQIPVWFSTGICAQTLVPLKYGITIILEPLYDFELFYRHIIKYKPNFMITACGLLDYLMNKQPYAKAYKEFKFLCAGGEYVTPVAERKYIDWLKANGNHYGFFKGYGMCECGGTITASSPNSNIIGSAGIPTPNVIVSAFDQHTGIELKYGERGELRILTPCRMLGYYRNSEATKEYFQTDHNGNIWACTGDMGYVTEDGNVYVDGRISDSYINEQNEQVFLFDIERTILRLAEIRQCKVVATCIDGIETHVAHVVCAKGCTNDAILSNIASICQEKLHPNHFPHLIRFYEDALPVSLSGKLNVAEMKRNIDNLVHL